MEYSEILISFFVGLIVGILGTFFGTRMVDKARERDEHKKERKKFKEALKIMPNLLKEMKQDLSDNQDGCMQFIVLRTLTSNFNSTKMYFIYAENDHPNIYAHLNILEKYGFIHDITFTDTPMYQFEFKFVNYLMKTKIELT